MGALDLVPRDRTNDGAIVLLCRAPAPVASFRRELYRRFDDGLRTIEMPRSTVSAFRVGQIERPVGGDEPAIRLVAAVHEPGVEGRGSDWPGTIADYPPRLNPLTGRTGA